MSRGSLRTVLAAAMGAALLLAMAHGAMPPGAQRLRASAGPPGAPASLTNRYADRLGLELPKEGVAAPEFTLPSSDGRTVSLKAYRGKVVFINFWATWCVPCRLEMPAMERLHKAYRKKGLVVLGVNLMEGRKEVRAFMDELGLSFPALLDGDGSVGFSYGIRPIPATYLVDQDGKVLWRVQGVREWDSPAAREYFDELLDQKGR